ncbi:NAD(P)H-hydrate dehydratase [Ruania suaedae]|uniref:NAD(P)H-hydrate dehydratase n=1 Tax=Ruania suaedae TaxID=2897774 RepID=UPI001E65C3AD|nr:NAD(P)H-hydrate dehydratase [Ruania suaedae]UFU02369.1 NAD(P)H-hydrate dehydratase [Ruania suaedae]
MICGYGADAVRAAEAPALAEGRPLMRWAAQGVAAAVRSELAHLPRHRARVFVLVGGGNNGGDGLYAAGLLAERGIGVDALLVREDVHLEGAQYARCRGVRLLTSDGDAWLREAALAQVWVDAMAGIGARGGLRGASAAVVDRLAGLRQERAVRVLAVDTPSGTGAEGGPVDGPVLRADRTLTMGAMKAGLLLPPAAGLAGRVEVLDLDLGAAFAGQEPLVRRLEPADVARLWPVPGVGDHKYTRGVLGVVAGSARYPGAAVLTVGAALRTGCGMVRYLVDEPAVADRVLDHYPEVVTGAGRVQALVLGPGMSDAADRERALHLVAQADEAAARSHAPLPGIVWDAGALAALPTDPQVNRRRRSVLTPHAGELAELLGGRGHEVDRAQVEAEPARWARIAAETTGATVLLKGAITVIADPDGALLTQADGPPWLATAGTGDVLAGVAGALLATARAPAAEVAAAAALVHGLAAHHANPGGPIVPSDLVAALPATVAQLLR